MKKIYTSAFVALAAMFISTSASAQLPDLSVAQDFTLTDINGNTHHLYDYLDQGKTVFIDISAAWCGPCWSYHTSGKLEALWAAHGPAGQPGVDANTTNDVMILFLEGELTNTAAQITGTTTNQSYSGFSQGDWTAGTPYPIIDLPNSSVLNDYNLNYFPTLYKICSNRILTLVSQNESVSSLYAMAQGCSPLPTESYDPALLNYSGSVQVCDKGTLPMKVRLQNMGSEPLTQVAIEAFYNGNSVGWYNWTGNLAKYAVTEVTIDEWFFPTANGPVFARIATPNVNTSNDQTPTEVLEISSVVSATNTVTVKITTDAFGSETTWKIKKSNGATVAGGSGGPFADHVTNNQPDVGEYAQTDKVVTLPANDCYSFEIYDAYGDGMSGSYGNGYYEVIDNNSNSIISGGSFNDAEVTKFGWGLTAVDEQTATVGIKVFPNPSTGNFNLDLNLTNKADVSITVTNAMGQMVYTENKQSIASGQHIYNMDFSAFADGIYLVSVNAGNKRYTQLVTIAK